MLHLTELVGLLIVVSLTGLAIGQKHKGKDKYYDKDLEKDNEYAVLDETDLIDDEEMLELLSTASKDDIETMMNSSPFLQEALKKKVKHVLKSRKKVDKVLKKIAKLQEEQDELFEKKDAKMAELKEKVLEKMIEKKFKLEELKNKFKKYSSY